MPYDDPKKRAREAEARAAAFARMPIQEQRRIILNEHPDVLTLKTLYQKRRRLGKLCFEEQIWWDEAGGRLLAEGYTDREVEIAVKR